TDFSAGLGKGVAGLKVGLSPDLGFMELDAEVEAAVRAAADVFGDLGAEVVEATPEIEDPIAPYYVLVRLAARAIVDSVPAAKRPLLNEQMRKDAAAADRHTAMDVKHAELEQRRIGAAMAQFFTGFDIMLTAATSVPAFDVGMSDPDNGKRADLPWSGALYTTNFTRQPGLSVPCGLTSDGLPVGLHVVGARHADAMVLRAAAAYEAARPGVGHPPLA
ncbi:MAG: amidase, partial [Rhodospirillaceae bacterium]|nr:amidase [Rhodospirillaceae bacterium]